MTLSTPLKAAVACLVLMTGCKTTEPYIDYVDRYRKSVEVYQWQFQKEISQLVSHIYDECYFKVTDRNDLSLRRHIELALNGLVFFELDENGEVTQAHYESKDRPDLKIRKQLCIENVSVGYMLPPSDGVQYIYQHFEIKISR